MDIKWALKYLLIRMNGFVGGIQIQSLTYFAYLSVYLFVGVSPWGP